MRITPEQLKEIKHLRLYLQIANPEEREKMLALILNGICKHCYCNMIDLVTKKEHDVNECSRNMYVARMFD